MKRQNYCNINQFTQLGIQSRTTDMFQNYQQCIAATAPTKKKMFTTSCTDVWLQLNGRYVPAAHLQTLADIRTMSLLSESSLLPRIIVNKTLVVELWSSGEMRTAIGRCATVLFLLRRGQYSTFLGDESWYHQWKSENLLHCVTTTKALLRDHSGWSINVNQRLFKRHLSHTYKLPLHLNSNVEHIQYFTTKLLAAFKSWLFFTHYHELTAPGWKEKLSGVLPAAYSWGKRWRYCFLL